MHFKNARNASVYAVFRAFFTQSLAKLRIRSYSNTKYWDCKIAFAGFYLKFIFAVLYLYQAFIFLFHFCFSEERSTAPQLKQRHKGRYLLWFSLPYFPSAILSCAVTSP